MGTRTYSRRAADGTRKLTALGRARAGGVAQRSVDPYSRVGLSLEAKRRKIDELRTQIDLSTEEAARLIDAGDIDAAREVLKEQKQLRLALDSTIIEVNTKKAYFDAQDQYRAQQKIVKDTKADFKRRFGNINGDYATQERQLTEEAARLIDEGNIDAAREVIKEQRIAFNANQAQINLRNVTGRLQYLKTKFEEAKQKYDTWRTSVKE